MTTPQRLPAGTLLGGRYRLLEPLPGAGRSWHARDEVDRRDLVARAVLLPAAMPAADRDLARRHALQDAAVVSRVRHPGIAPVVDAVVEDGTPWVISVRPAGRSLGEVVGTGGPVAADVAALVGLQVVDALEAAGVPHGDLTPDDVLLGPGGQVTVTGFATTRVDGTETPGFRAPEGGPSAAADLWALGVTLYVAVEGRLPDGPGGGALRPALDQLLAIDPAQRSDTDEIRRLLAVIGGAPPPPTYEAHDPDVAAALAALDAAIRTPSPPRVAYPEDRPAPPFPPTALAGPSAVAGTPADTARSGDPTQPRGASDVAAASAPLDPADPADHAEPAASAGPGDRAEPGGPADAGGPPDPSRPADRRGAGSPVGSGERGGGAETADLAGGAPAARGSSGGAEVRGATRAIGRPTRKRWWWGAVAAVGLLVIAILVPVLRQRGDSAPAVSQPEPTVTATSAPTSAAPTVTPPPAGYRLYRDPAGWSMAVPQAWPATHRAGVVTFRDGDHVLTVRERPTPPADPYTDLLAKDKARGATIPGYEFLRVARISYRTWPTADWEYRAGTQPVMHTVIRTTVPAPGEAYDISWTTEDRRWSAERGVFRTAVRTFDPGD